MKVLLNVTLRELENKINRQIEVDENINLKDLCEYIIISMNGSKIPFYVFYYGDITYYPYLIKETKNEKNLENLLFKDFNLKKDMHFTISYNFDNYYYFEIVVDGVYESKDKAIFKVLSGKGYGILDYESLSYLRIIFDAREDCLRKSEKKYLETVFDCEECNKRVTDYIESKDDNFAPKRYVFNITLDGFNKEIKRKIIVNNNILIDKFCKCVIVAMNGDLSHSYGIKVGKYCECEYYDDLELFYLNLKEKQKLKIIYDWGDNWVFNLTLSKMISGYGDADFEVLSGKGYGIIDDVGGISGLEDIYSGKDTSWGKYNINNFDLEKCNKSLRKIK